MNTKGGLRQQAAVWALAGAGALYCAGCLYPGLWLSLARWIVYSQFSAAALLLRAWSEGVWAVGPQALLYNGSPVMTLKLWYLKPYLSLLLLGVVLVYPCEFKHAPRTLLFLFWYGAAGVISVVPTALLVREFQIPVISVHTAVFGAVLALFPFLLHIRSITGSSRYEWMTTWIKPGSAYLVMMLPGLAQQTMNGFLQGIILPMSRAILVFLDYSVHITGNTLTNGLNWVRVGEPCVGVRVMAVFTAFIILTFQRRSTGACILFLLAGLWSILMINSLRVALLFISLVDQTINKGMFAMEHDLYNFFIYLYIFGLWWLWLRSGAARGCWNVLTRASG